MTRLSPHQDQDAAASRTHRSRGIVRPIFITVDPAHDTPEITRRYTRDFSRRILGLTGSPAQVGSVEKAYGVQTAFRRTGPEVSAYVIDHPSAFYLVGPDGRFVTELQADEALRVRIGRDLGWDATVPLQGQVHTL